MKTHLRLLTFAFVAVSLAACGNGDNGAYQGWAEGEFIFVGPDENGRMADLNVRAGDTVKTGDLLFTVDAQLQEADLKVTEAALAVAKQAYERAQALSKTGSGSQKTYDEALSALRQAEANERAAQTRLDRRRLMSPVSGTVQQIYYRPGEMVTAGRPAVSILPPGNLKLRFYVPQSEIAKIRIGDAVKVSCDNCAENIAAKVSFIAGSAEYTPPVIYSQEERNKLVFLIEARPEKPELLRVGQPVSVELEAKK
jgi:HlyD family secretion protein